MIKIEKLQPSFLERAHRHIEGKSYPLTFVFIDEISEYLLMGTDGKPLKPIFSNHGHQLFDGEVTKTAINHLLNGYNEKTNIIVLNNVHSLHNEQPAIEILQVSFLYKKGWQDHLLAWLNMSIHHAIYLVNTCKTEEDIEDYIPAHLELVSKLIEVVAGREEMLAFKEFIFTIAGQEYLHFFTPPEIKRFQNKLSSNTRPTPRSLASEVFGDSLESFNVKSNEGNRVVLELHLANNLAMDYKLVDNYICLLDEKLNTDTVKLVTEASLGDGATNTYKVTMSLLGR